MLASSDSDRFRFGDCLADSRVAVILIFVSDTSVVCRKLVEARKTRSGCIGASKIRAEAGHSAAIIHPICARYRQHQHVVRDDGGWLLLNDQSPT